MTRTKADKSLKSPAPRLRGIVFQLFILLLIDAAVRLAWMQILPVQSYSVDLKDWRIIANALTTGLDPFQYHQMSWPPFWMEVLYLTGQFCARFGFALFPCLRIVVMIGDLGVLAALFWLLRLKNSKAGTFWLLLLGYCLNPVFILLTIQHANFDAFAMVWVILFVAFLTKFCFQIGDGPIDPLDWLLACGTLGLGIFTKTFPLMLTPLLAPGARRADWRARLLGIALVVGPTFLSLTPVYVLHPADITRDVLHYRSFGATFGVKALLTLGGFNTALSCYTQWIPSIFLGGLAVFGIVLWLRGGRSQTDPLLVSFLIILTALTVGTGYAPQYLFWVMPLAVVCWRQYPGILRITITVWCLITAATTIVEYATAPWLGSFFYYWFPSEALREFGQKGLVDDTQWAWMQLPMTIVTMVLVAICIVTARRQAVKQNLTI